MFFLGFLADSLNLDETFLETAGCHKTMGTAEPAFLSCGTGGDLFCNLGGDLCCTKCMLLFSHHTCCVFLGASVHYCQGTLGSWLPPMPKRMSFIRLGGINMWFSCGDDSSRFLHMFVSSHLLFHDEFSLGLTCYIRGVWSFTVLLTAARRVLGNLDTPGKDILNLFYTVITRQHAKVVHKAQSRSKSFHPCLWALDSRPAGCCCS